MGSEDLLLQVERVRALAQRQLRAYGLAIGLLTRLRRYETQCEEKEGLTYYVITEEEHFSAFLDDLDDLLVNNGHLLSSGTFLAMEAMRAEFACLDYSHFTAFQRMDFTADHRQQYEDLREQVLQEFQGLFGLKTPVN